jgi:aspartyl-tRNA(Asn)/glutamyl-tRNA(Gln) amidotransferase subunit C
MTSKDDLIKIANLAKLSFSDEEMERFQGQFSSVLDFVSELDSVDTSNVQPTFNVHSLVTIVREDLEGPNVNQENLIAAFPKKEGSLLKVKTVFENNEE